MTRAKSRQKVIAQKLKLFNLGSAISEAPIIIGTNQFASPTNAGHNSTENHNQTMQGKHLIIQTLVGQSACRVGRVQHE